MKPLSLCSLIAKRPALEFFVIMSLLIQYLTEYRGAARYTKLIRKYVSYKHYELLGMSPVYSVFKIFVCFSCSVVSSSLRPHGLYSLWGSSAHGISQARITGVGCHFLPQEVFPTQGSNLRLLFPVLASGFFTTAWTTWEAPSTLRPTTLCWGWGMLHACLFVIVASFAFWISLFSQKVLLYIGA